MWDNIKSWATLISAVIALVLIPSVRWWWRKTFVSKEELAASEEKHKATIGELTARIAQLEHEVKLLEVRIDNLPQRSDFVDLQGTVNNLSREIGSLKAVSEANQRTLSRIDDYLLNGHRA